MIKEFCALKNSKTMKFKNLRINNSLLGCMEEWAMIALIFLFTFPAYAVDYGIGLDFSFTWGLNWLFVNDYETLKQLIYPFGPLGFLKAPSAIGNNLLIAILFYSVLKLGFIALCFKLSDMLQNTKKYAAYLMVFIVSYFTDIDTLLIGSCVILNLIYYKNKNFIPFITGGLLAFIGLFIKVSIGVSALSVIAVSMLISLFYQKNIILLLKQAGIMATIGLLTGLAVFGNFTIYFRFLIGTIMLSSGYGDTLSLHPDNNWFFVTPFIILMLLFPFIYKDKNLRIAYLMLLFPLFAAWKHSFIREDTPHYIILTVFLFIYWGIIFIVSSQKKFIPVIAALTILLIYANMWEVQPSDYGGMKREVAGVNNFRKVLRHNHFKERITAMSEKEISKNRLDSNIQELIGDNTVDAYPWEFSYISANQLKWKPRTTLEVGASTSRWASQKASENYLLTEDAPQFVILHTQRDVHGGAFGSIDNRHILNDEPLVIYNLLNNYSLVEKNDKFLLFKRDTVSHFDNVYLDEFHNYSFGEWIDVPYNADEIIRFKVFSSNTFFGKIIKFLYKETEYFIDYQYENEHVLTYRYVPGTAVDGLWCNPFIQQPNTNELESKVVKIRFRNANPRGVKKLFKAQFQHIKLNPALQNSTNIANLLFHKSVTPYKENIINLFQQSDNETSKLNGFTNQVEKHEFSYGYKIHLDSLFCMVEFDTLIVEASILVNNRQTASFVISSKGSEDDFYAINYLPECVSKQSWYYFYLNKLITKDKHSTGTLKVYVYNNGNLPIYIDDFRLSIRDGRR